MTFNPINCKHPNGEPFTANEIEKQWQDVGLDARNRGTWMHYNIERFFNGKSNFRIVLNRFLFYFYVISKVCMIYHF
jgi:hypothetical protein